MKQVKAVPEGAVLMHYRSPAKPPLDQEHPLICTPCPINSNMPGEERWRLLNLEPTRALGHANKKHAPLHSPEIYEWVFHV